MQNKVLSNFEKLILVLVGVVSRKKVAVLLDFAQIFRPLFKNCIYWVNLGMEGKGENPAQIFWHIGVQKSGTSCPIGGRGGSRGNLDKIQKNNYFFFS